MKKYYYNVQSKELLLRNRVKRLTDNIIVYRTRYSKEKCEVLFTIFEKNDNICLVRLFNPLTDK